MYLLFLQLNFVHHQQPWPLDPTYNNQQRKKKRKLWCGNYPTKQNKKKTKINYKIASCRKKINANFYDAFSKGNKFFHLGIAFTTAAVIRIKTAPFMFKNAIFFSFCTKIHSSLVQYNWVAFKYNFLCGFPHEIRHSLVYIKINQLTEFGGIYINDAAVHRHHDLASSSSWLNEILGKKWDSFDCIVVTAIDQKMVVTMANSMRIDTPWEKKKMKSVDIFATDYNLFTFSHRVNWHFYSFFLRISLNLAAMKRFES